MQPFRSLDVWRKAHELTLQIYQVTEQFPKAETFGVSMQLRRGSMSIALKIAEGCGQDGSADFVRCLQHARGLGVELEYMLLLGLDLQLIKGPDYEMLRDQLIEVRKMLSGLMKTLRTQPV